MWEEILAEPAPPADLVGTTAFWRYARTVALSALGRVKEAGAELKALKSACAAVPESRLIGNNTVQKVLAVGLPMAEGEYEYRRDNHARAFRLLSLAVQRGDSLRHDEPWGWMMPIRHSLGALLLEQGKIAEAERVYRDDLAIHPDNGWALKGLAECLHRTGRHEEAEETDERFQAARARSDIPLKASCFCGRRARACAHRGSWLLMENHKKKDPQTGGRRTSPSRRFPSWRRTSRSRSSGSTPSSASPNRPPFSEATLVRELERSGIGRPSTYASILATLDARDYVERREGRLGPTRLGFVVTDILVARFPDLMSVSYTAKMEEDLDAIEEGRDKLLNTLTTFWRKHEKELASARLGDSPSAPARAAEPAEATGRGEPV